MLEGDSIPNHRVHKFFKFYNIFCDHVLDCVPRSV